MSPRPFSPSRRAESGPPISNGSPFDKLRSGKWSWIAVAQRLCKILVATVAPPVWYLVIDDTLVPRASKKAPDVGFHFDHSRKPNRPKYLWGQGWVTLAAVVHADTVATSWAVPLISRLVRKTGNQGKLSCARGLLRVVRGLFGRGRPGLRRGRLCCSTAGSCGLR